MHMYTCTYATPTPSPETPSRTISVELITHNLAVTSPCPELTIESTNAKLKSSFHCCIHAQSTSSQNDVFVAQTPFGENDVS